MNQANGFSFEFWRVARCRSRHRVDSLRRLSHPKLWFVRRPGSSPAFNHGLCFGSRQPTILTPSPLSLTRRLWEPSQLLTSLETCQLALSQMRTRTFLPPTASSFRTLHSRKRVVIEETGLPSTNLIHVRSRAGR